SYFDSPTENVDNGEPKFADDAQKQDEDGLNNENVEQERFSDDTRIKTHLSISKEVGTPRYLSLVVPLTKVGDEAVHKELGDIMERAATTASSLEAEQDSDTILGDVNAQTRFEITSIQSIDPPLSRGYTLGSGEDSMKLIGIDEIWLKLVLSVLVSAVKRMLMLPVQVSAVEVNPVIYTSCIEQFWATVKVQTVSGVRQIQALVDKKRVIVTESSIRRDLHLDDAEGTDCLLTSTIFEELAYIGAKSTTWNEFSSSMASLFICLATNQKFNLSKYIFDAMVKHLDEGVKFLLYPQMGEDSDHPTDSTPIPIIDQPSSSSQSKKDKSSKKAQRQEAEVPQDEAGHKESVPTPSNDPQPSGEDSMQLTELMEENLEESLGVPEDASKQERSIADIDVDVEVTLVDETQVRQNDDLIFDTRFLDDVEMHVEAKVDGKYEQSTKTDDSTAGEAVTIAAKPKVVTTAATTSTTTRPKDRGVVVQEPSEFRVPQEIKPSSSKDKGKGIMIEPEVPLKRKDQIALDEQIARDIEAKLDAKLLEEQKMARKQEKEANIALIESWENTQAIMEADRLQSKERKELTNEEKSKLFMELLEKRRKHFAALRAQEKRNRPPTKAQKRT
ncbi:hypothetical protein Tco_0577952, partial [Tanacetum coccineum]